MNAITIGKLGDRALEIIAERARTHHTTIEDEVAEIVELAALAPRSSD